jgi:hypothetical protein
MVEAGAEPRNAKRPGLGGVRRTDETKMDDETVANLPRSNTLTAKVAALFASRPNDWIDGRDVALVGGAYGWRTRIADAR